MPLRLHREDQWPLQEAIATPDHNPWPKTSAEAGITLPQLMAFSRKLQRDEPRRGMAVMSHGALMLQGMHALVAHLIQVEPSFHGLFPSI